MTEAQETNDLGLPAEAVARDLDAETRQGQGDPGESQEAVDPGQGDRDRHRSHLGVGLAPWEGPGNRGNITPVARDCHLGLDSPGGSQYESTGRPRRRPRKPSGEAAGAPRAGEAGQAGPCPTSTRSRKPPRG